MKIPELLAPAGSPEGLKMAVQYGADAVYLGAKDFSARRSAANFDMQELNEAFDYCHERGVKAYLTLNTLIKDEEFNHAYELGIQAAQLGADALIIQDAGLIDAFARNTNIPIHISTQASLCSLYDILSWKNENANVKRVVLAREIPIEDIKYIKRNSSMELEIFIHGALCVSFSGQCLLSSMAGGRSGNRGACAQPCRREYSLYKNGAEINKGYLLSARDLCTIDYLSGIVESGVDSLKIEGRLKRPEYVGAVVEQYRLALDCIKENKAPDTEKAKKELCEIFNRGGFTKGYYLSRDNIIFNKQPNNTGVLIGKSISKNARKILFEKEICAGDSVEIRRDGRSLGGGSIYSLIQNGRRINKCTGQAEINGLNINENAEQALVYKTSSIEQLERLKRGLRNERVKRPLKMLLYQKERELFLTVQFAKYSYTAKTELVSKEGVPPDEEGIKGALSRLGNTPFKACEIIIKLCNDCFFTLSDVNRLRRECANGLLDKMRFCAKQRYTFKTLPAPETYFNTKDKAINVAEVYDLRGLEKALMTDAYQEIYFRPRDWGCIFKDALQNMLQKSSRQNTKIYFAALPGCFQRDYAMLERNIDYIRSFDGILAESPAFIYFAQKYKLAFIAGPSLNILNSYAAALYMRRGAERICLSYEMDKEHIRRLAAQFPVEIRLEGRIPLMLLMHCPRKEAGEKCSDCFGKYILKDAQGRAFILEKYKFSFCRHVLYNCKITSLIKHRRELEQMGVAALSFSQWNNYEQSELTRGHYLRGIE